MQYILDHYNYWVFTLLFMTGLYMILGSSNLVRKIIGLAVFQTSVLLFYISLAAVKGGAVPMLKSAVHFYVNPLPHVLMLTAIVVGVSTMAVGLALIVRIKEEYGSIEEEDIARMESSSAPIRFHIIKKKRRKK